MEREEAPPEEKQTCLHSYEAELWTEVKNCNFLLNSFQEKKMNE